MEFEAYTDGGCSGNRRDSDCVGGYAYIILDPSETIISEGGGKGLNTTNNRMEMTAFIEGLKEARRLLNEEYGGAEKHSITVFTDSKYVAENFVDYLPEWKKNKWRKANKSQVINKDLWKKLDVIAPEFKAFKFKWIKGHANNKLNNRADAAAQGYMRDHSENKVESCN